MPAISLWWQDAIRGMISGLLYTLWDLSLSLYCSFAFHLLYTLPFLFVYGVGVGLREIWGQAPFFLLECWWSANLVAQQVGSALFLPDFEASVVRSSGHVRCALGLELSQFPVLPHQPTLSLLFNLYFFCFLSSRLVICISCWSEFCKQIRASPFLRNIV